VYVLGDDESNTSNYLRSSSPEYDEVVLTDNSEDEELEEEEEELSEEIPIIVQRPKSPKQDTDDDAILFDDSESNEFSLPHLDLACIESSSQDVNNDGTLSLGLDKVSTRAARPFMSTELEITDTSQHEVINSALMSKAANVNNSKEYRAEVSEGDTSISEGLGFNISDVSHLETTLKAAEESPVVHSLSRLSRKRSRILSKDEAEERVQCKRLNTSIFAESGSVVAQPVIPMLVTAESEDIESLVRSSIAESSSEPGSFATDTAVISNCSSPPRNMFSQDFNVSFSEGTQ